MGWIASERRQSAHEIKIAELLEEKGWHVQFEGPLGNDPAVETGNPFDDSPENEPVKLTVRQLAAQVLGERIVHLDVTKTVDRLDPLDQLTRLRVLIIEKSNDDNLAPLAKLTLLSMLGIGGKPIDDLTPLTGLRNLEILSVYDTQVSDLKPLASLNNLQTLRIIDTRVTDLTPISRLLNLKSLDLFRTQVTDFTPLVGLKNLNELGVSDDFVSKEQIVALRQMLPNCEITRYRWNTPTRIRTGKWNCRTGGWIPCD